MDGNGLGSALRALREDRGLGMGEAARRAGVPRPTVSAWESGQARPRGAALVRLLDVLEAAPRLRARLLHAADPRYARFELANTTLGAPVDVGSVIRAMRDRRGMVQADLARAAGVSQAAVARWESGDDAPGAESLHKACYALGASAEEMAALACAQNRSSGGIPDDPEASLAFSSMTLGATPWSLREVVSLEMEAELWRRSTRDARWDPHYCCVLGDRANDMFLMGRLREAEETARRALRRANTPEARREATPAVGALVALARHGEAPPAPLAARLSAWVERLPNAPHLMRSWMRYEHARFLAKAGREAEGMDEAERAVAELSEGGVAEGATASSIEYNARKYRVEVLLETDRPERAAALCPSLAPVGVDSPTRLFIGIPAWHAAREPAPEVYMDELRGWVLGGDADRWIHRKRLAKMELDQARLTGA